MLKGYHRSFWDHAAQMVQRPPAIPGLELAIDTGEILNPIRTNVILMPPNVLRRPNVEAVRTDNDIAKMGLGSPLDVTMFPADYYQGQVVK